MKPEEVTVPDAIARDGASCAVYRDAPRWQGRRTAAIGQFACDSAPGAGSDFHFLLPASCD